MVRYIRVYQIDELNEFSRELKVKAVWLKMFDGTQEAVHRIRRILRKQGMEIVKAYTPHSVTRIGDWAFEDYHSLTSITIPNSVTRIGA